MLSRSGCILQHFYSAPGCVPKPPNVGVTGADAFTTGSTVFFYGIVPCAAYALYRIREGLSVCDQRLYGDCQPRHSPVS